MYLLRASLVCALGLILCGCVTTSSSTPSNFAPPTDYVPLDQIQIVNRFEVVDVTAANLDAEARRCVPTMPPNAKSVTDTAGKLPLARGHITGLAHLSSSSTLVIVGGRAICIRQSAARFPIFAADALTATVNPSGVPPTVTDGWYAQIVRRLAETGRVTVAYAFPNGNAEIASYWVEPASKNAIHYAREFKRAGSWESGTYDFRFSNPSLSGVSSTKRGTSMSRIDFISDR